MPTLFVQSYEQIKLIILVSFALLAAPSNENRERQMIDQIKITEIGEDIVWICLSDDDGFRIKYIRTY